MSPIVYTPALWPNGLRCGECHAEFTPGQTIVQQFDGLIGDLPVTVPVCEPCGLRIPVRGLAA